MEKKITDEEYNKAWENELNQKTMATAVKPYLGMIPDDELLSCKMLTLWKSLSNFDSGRGIQFSTYLYRSIVNGCRNWLRSYNRDKRAVQAAVSSYKDKETVSDISHLTESLDSNNAELIHQRYVMNMTLEEIAKKNGYSPQKARRKLNKAIWKVKKSLS